MPFQLLPSPDLLKEEIARLLPAVEGGRGKAIGQQKSELAALLFEAHRTGAYRAWGYKTLGQYARTLELNPATFAKYKSAGKVLHDREPVAYRTLMTAVVSNVKRPKLPTVSDLAATQSLDKQVGRQHEVVELRHRGVPLGKVKTLAALESYGGASAEGRRVLSALDSFVQDAQRARDVLLNLPGAKHVPADQLARRLSSIRGACQAVLSMLDLRAPKT